MLDKLLQPVIQWAMSQPQIHGLLLAGSYARGQARPDSDIDLVVLTPQPDAFRHDTAWISAIDWQAAGVRALDWRDADYGMLWSRHLRLDSAPELEFGFAPLAWAATSPVDEGTHRVISDGCRILYDPHNHFAALVAAVQKTE